MSDPLKQLNNLKLTWRCPICGIVGISSKTPIDPAEMKILLLLAQSRGKDSCGIATPDTIIKEANLAEVFIRKHIPETNLIIGHTRAKTTGIVCNKNAHPFQNGDIIGTHNGYISNFYTLKSEEKTSKMEVDSEIIWHLINKYGLKKTIPKLEGGFALAWIDKKKQLNLYRHSNPIYFGEKERTIYYGSEKKYLEFLECDNINFLKEHTHCIIKNGKVKKIIDLSNIKPKTHTSSNSWAGLNKKQSKLAPVWAKTVKGYTDNALLYYWFDATETRLMIEPAFDSYTGWKETFVLTLPKHITRLKKDFPEVYYLKEVQTSIKTLQN